MGAAALGQCYPSQVAAANAACAAYPVQGVSGAETYSVACVGVSAAGDSLTLQRYASSASEPVAQSLSVAFAPCDELEHFKDVGSVWGLCLAVVVPLAVLAASYRRFLMPQ